MWLAQEKCVADELRVGSRLCHCILRLPNPGVEQRRHETDGQRSAPRSVQELSFHVLGIIDEQTEFGLQSPEIRRQSTTRKRRIKKQIRVCAPLTGAQATNQSLRAPDGRAGSVNESEFARP